MKILMVSPEVSPLAKVGGLGDVVGALSKELARLGHEVRVVLPLYGFLKPKADWQAYPHPVSVHLGRGREEFCRIWETPLPGSKAMLNLVEFNRYYDRPAIYGGHGGAYSDNHERFAFLCRTALDWCNALAWQPDVIHCHDWGAALVPVYLNSRDQATPLGRAASVYTIHNLQYQGHFGRELLDFAGLPDWLYTANNLESYGGLNLMKGGLYHATKLTTVSRHYAEEIKTPGGGCGLHHILQYRAGDLIGVVNGIDTTEWNPATDRHLPARFHAGDLQGKAACKRALQERFGLAVDAQVPVFGAVARLVDQKGLDLVASILPSLLHDMKLQVVILGNGDAAMEHQFNELARRYPGQVGVFIGFHETLAHLIEAGADFFLMPSRFEPCGLNQMYSQVYGTPPIVRATGGLVDTVQQYHEGKGEGTGFIFQEPTARALYYTIGWACSTFFDRPDDLLALRRNGMKKDFSWTISARQYVEIYQWAVQARRGG